MEEAQNIHDFLPYSYSNQEEQSYIRFLWESFENNYDSEKYEFANIAFHMLYMSYIAFSVWQIRTIKKEDFKKAMIGFQTEMENHLLNTDSPFKFF